MNEYDLEDTVSRSGPIPLIISNLLNSKGKITKNRSLNPFPFGKQNYPSDPESFTAWSGPYHHVNHIIRDISKIFMSLISLN